MLFCVNKCSLPSLFFSPPVTHLTNPSNLDCAPVFQESKCLLGTFFCLVLILFVVVGAGAIAGFVMGSDTILEKIKTGLQKSINDYNDKDSVQKSWNFLQENVSSCVYIGFP